VRRQLFEGGYGRCLACGGQDVEVTLAWPNHYSPLPVPAIHRSAFVAGRLVDFLFARPTLLVLQPENLGVFEMDRAERLVTSFGIEPMLQRQLLLKDLFKLGVGVIVAVVFIAFI